MQKQKVDLLITNGTVVTVDSKRHVLRRGAVAVDGSKIEAVGATEKVESLFDAERSIDASDMIVCPGLIDTHVHLVEALLRGCGEDIDAQAWLHERMWPLQGDLTPEEARSGIALGLLEMIKSGTTTFLEVKLDEKYGFTRIAELIQRSGIRGVLSKAISDSEFTEKSPIDQASGPECERTIRTTIEQSRDCRRDRNERVIVWFGPRPVGSCSRETYRALAVLAKEHNIGVTIHHSEFREQVALSKKRYGALPTRLMEEVGLVGKRVVFAHCTWLSAQEIDILVRTGTSCAHVPSSEMKLGMGVAPIAQMLRSGANVAVGCNGGANNNTYDMFREMSRACCLHRGVTLDAGAVTNLQALEMATINGARALGLDSEVGSIETGKKADIVIIDCRQAHLQPLVDPIATLVHSASGQDVHTVIANGRVLMRGRTVQTMGEESVIADARRLNQKLLDRSGLSLRPYV